MKTILLLIAMFISVFLVAQWFWFPTQWEREIKLRYYTHKFKKQLNKTLKRELINIFGGTPKKTRKGYKVGKTYFGTTDAFTAYMKDRMQQAARLYEQEGAQHNEQDYMH